MAIYRESPSSRRLIPLVAALVIGVLLIVAVAVVVISRSNNNAPLLSTSETGLPAAAALDKLSTSLDLFQIEYDKVKAGTAVDKTGAPGAIANALNALTASPNLSKLNQVAYTDLQSDLSTLSMALHTSPPIDVTKILADVQKQLKLLNLSSAPNTPATASH